MPGDDDRGVRINPADAVDGLLCDGGPGMLGRCVDLKLGSRFVENVVTVNLRIAAVMACEFVPGFQEQRLVPVFSVNIYCHSG